MRFRAAVVLVLWAVAAFAGTELPEIVARCGAKTVSREQAARLLQQADPAVRKKLSRRELLKKVLIDHFCSEALSKMLSDAGFPPDAARSLTMLKKSRDAMKDHESVDDGTLFRLSRERKVQLQCALRAYLQARRPDVFLVPPVVVERFYRENQQIFLRSRQAGGMRYAAKKAADLQTLLFCIRQGEKPEAVLARMKEISGSVVSGDHPALAGLPPGAWSPVTEIPGAGYALYRVSPGGTAGYIPLAEAAPVIREMMVRRRTAVELERALARALGSEKMEFYF